MGYKPVSSRRIDGAGGTYKHRSYIGHTHFSKTLRRHSVCAVEHDHGLISNSIAAALYFIGGVRVTFSTGIAAGGNLAYWYAPILYTAATSLTEVGRAISLPSSSRLSLRQSLQKSVLLRLPPDRFTSGLRKQVDPGSDDSLDLSSHGGRPLRGQHSVPVTPNQRQTICYP